MATSCLTDGESSPTTWMHLYTRCTESLAGQEACQTAVIDDDDAASTANGAFGEALNNHLQGDHNFGKMPRTRHSKRFTGGHQETSTRWFSLIHQTSEAPNATKLDSCYRNSHSDCVKPTGQQIDFEYRATIGIRKETSRVTSHQAAPTTCFAMAEPVILSQSSSSSVASPVASFKAAFASPPPPVVAGPGSTSPSSVCNSSALSPGSYHHYKSSTSAKYNHSASKPMPLFSSRSTTNKNTPTQSSTRSPEASTRHQSSSPLHCSTSLNGTLSTSKHSSPSPSTSPQLARSPDRSLSPSVISSGSRLSSQKTDRSKKSTDASPSCADVVDGGQITDSGQLNHSSLTSDRHILPQTTKQDLINSASNVENEFNRFEEEDQERPNSSRTSASDSNGPLINGHREEDMDDDDMMNNFDPAEVLKRMKVEFDETDRNDAISAQLVESDCDNISSTRHKDLHKSLLGPFFGHFENEYFRKLFQMSEVSEMVESGNPSLAALTAAAAVAAASPSEALLDENKKRLLQTLLLKQLNGDSNGLDASLVPEMQPSTSSALNGCTTPSAAQTAAAAVNFFNSLMPKLVGKSFDEPEQRYCSSCNIQFMSSKTYKVHKELYCSSRHQNSSSTSSTTSSTAPAFSSNFTMTGSSLCTGSSKSSPLINSQTSSGLGSSPPPSSFSSVASPNSSSNSTSIRKRACMLGADMSSLPTGPRTDPTRHDMILSEESVASASAHPPPSFADLASMFPHLMQSSLNGLANAGGASSASGASLAPPTDPIYIVISTSPLVLLPFACNPVTNGLEPLTNHLSGALNQASVIESLGKSFAPQPTSTIVFPTGLPNTRQSSSDLTTASTSTNHASQSPFVTSFANLRDHLSLSTSGSELQPSCSSPTKSSISDKPVSSTGKKRSLTESFPEGSSEQPLDLSSSSPKRCKESDDLSHRSLSPTNIKKEPEEESASSKGLSFQEHMANFIQKIAMMNPMPSSQPLTSTTPAPEPASNLLFQGAASSTPVTDQLSVAAALTRDNPAFAQYIAMAVAALTGSSLPSSNNFAPNVPGSQPHIDVVVKQGNSRCNDCNIVFYKYENYLVHKKLYCASRRTLDSSQSQPSSSPTHCSSINRPPSASPSCPSPVGSQASFSQQAAKFAATLATTNPDLVRAALKPDIETPLALSTSPALSREASSVSPVASIMSPGKQSAVFQYYCVACGIKFTSYDNLHAHQTYYCLKRGQSTAGSSSTAAAPVSPARVSPLPASPVPSGATPQSLLLATAAAAAGLGAQTNPETLLADLASQNALSQQWAQMVAAAAAVAKSNGAIPPGASFGDFNCHKCKASYVSQETLAAHVCSADIRLPEKPEKSANVTPSTASLQTYKCTICGYKGHTMRGMRTHVRVHSDELATSGAFEEDFIVQNTDLPEPSSGRRGSHGNSLTNPSRQRRRSSGVDAAFLNASGVDAMDIRSAVNSYLESAARRNKEALEERNVIRHIKLVHKDVALQHVQASKDGEANVAVGGAVAPSDLDERCSQKSEEGASTGKSPSRHLNGSLETGSNASTTSPEAPNGAAGEADTDSNYCSSCNISFTYRNSYIAHKKYYCSSHNNET